MKYVKVLDKSLCHNGFQYKEGLNIDTEVFNPKPVCGGGLHFAAIRDVFAFSDFGFFVADVTVPRKAKCIEMKNGDSVKYKAHCLVLKNIRPLWDEHTIKGLIKNGADIHALSDYSFYVAALKGHADIVQYLLKLGANIHAFRDGALRMAIMNGHQETVKTLLKNGALNTENESAMLQLAISNDDIAILKLLLDAGAKASESIKAYTKRMYRFEAYQLLN